MKDEEKWSSTLELPSGWELLQVAVRRHKSPADGAGVGVAVYGYVGSPRAPRDEPKSP